MWSQPKAAKRIASLFFLVLTCEFSCFQISFIIGGTSTVGIDLFFAVLRTCSPNTRDSAANEEPQGCSTRGNFSFCV